MKNCRQKDPGTGAGCFFSGNAALFVAILFFGILRQMLIIGMPVFVRGSTCDDVLMIEMAEGLSKGQWLGKYSGLTLMKGCFYPAFIAATYKIGIPALHAITALHTLACGFFVFELRPLIRKKWKGLVLFVLLLFEPASFAERTFQADYRNSLTILQVLFLFGTVFGLYLNYGKSRLGDFLKAVFLGMCLLSFWNTREDAVWVLPFVLVGSIIVLIRAVVLSGPASAETHRRNRLRDFSSGISAPKTSADSTGETVYAAFSPGVSSQRRFDISERMCKILFAGALCVIPFVFLFGGNELIRQKNKEIYGLPIRLEASEGNFSRALRSIYSVRNEEEIRYVSVTKEKLDRLYAVSPSLQSIRGELNKYLASYDKADRHRGDGEVEDGWFLWALRRAAFDAGKTRSLAEAESFYGTVSKEIEEALDDPSGGLQRIRTMPSALMSPWRAGYLKELPAAMIKGWIMTAVMQDTSPSVKAYSISDEHLNLVEQLTGGFVIRETGTDPEIRKKAEEACARADLIGSLYRRILPPVAALSVILFPLLFIVETGKRKINQNFFLIMAGILLSEAVMLAGVGYTDITAFTAVRGTYLAGAYPLALTCIVLTVFEALEVAGKNDANIR